MGYMSAKRLTFSGLGVLRGKPPGGAIAETRAAVNRRALAARSPAARSWIWRRTPRAGTTPWGWGGGSGTTAPRPRALASKVVFVFFGGEKGRRGRGSENWGGGGRGGVGSFVSFRFCFCLLVSARERGCIMMIFLAQSESTF